MTKPFDRYQDLSYTLPKETLAWNMYAAGTENIGKRRKTRIISQFRTQMMTSCLSAWMQSGYAFLMLNY